MSLHILVIEDSIADFRLIERELTKSGLSICCVRAERQEEVYALLEAETWDVLISDYNLPSLIFEELLAAMRSRHPDIPIVLVSGSLGEEKAVELLKLGVSDFVLKDNLLRLAPAVQRSLRDVTDRNARREAEQALRASEARANLLLETAPVAMLVIDEQWRVVQANGNAAKTFDYPVAALTGKTVEQLMAEDLRTRYRALLAKHRQRPATTFQGRRLELLGLRGDGQEFPAEISLGSTTIDGRVHHIASVVDISERKQAQQQMELAASAFENMAEAIVVTDAENRVVSINRAFTEITGYRFDEIKGQDPKLLGSLKHDDAFYLRVWSALHKNGTWSGEMWNRRKNGELFLEWLTIRVMRDRSGAINHHIGVFADITEQRAAIERIEFLAHHDPLTELPNRALLADRLHQMCLHAKRYKEQVAVLFLDLDRFKSINDSLGHATGDALLREIAQRLRHCLRASDTIARLGGDEFVLALANVEDGEWVARVVSSVVEAVSRPLVLGGNVLRVTPSIGISLFPRDGTDVNTLLKNADNAMYHAKAAGRATYRFFSEEMDVKAQQRFRIEAELREALCHGQFVLYYQKQVDSRSRLTTGSEALLRWRHPALGLLPPSTFLHVAEDCGLIESIGNWVLRESCRQGKHWMDAGSPLRIAINVSAQQFRSGRLLDNVAQVLAETGFPATYLEMELTEGSLMEPSNQTLTTLTGLRELGISISVDDFGTGYSSLSYLKRYPINRLKIAKDFVDAIDTDADDHAIAKAVIALARSLKLETVAEGVETQAQLDVLRELGCDEIQGYLFGHPVQPAEFPFDPAPTRPL